jgi:hypothetical protein
MNFLHFWHRHIVTEPQLGQKNLTAFSLGIIILLQEMHVGTGLTLFYRHSAPNAIN